MNYLIWIILIIRKVNFELRYIPLDKVEEELKSNAVKYGDKYNIASEMLRIFDYYKNR